MQAEAFFREIRILLINSISQHSLDRCLDLYFLNIVEYLIIVFSSKFNKELLISVATLYLGLDSNQRLLEIFESAYNVILTVLSTL